MRSTCGMRWLVMVLLIGPGAAFGQLRVVTYNTATTGSSAFWNRQSYLSDVLEYIGLEERNGIAKPIDVLILQEQYTGGVSNVSAQNFANLLNTIHGTSTYQAWTHVPTAYDGFPVGFVYNSASVSLQTQTSFRASGLTRDTGRISVRPVGYGADADIYVYNTHYKASTGDSNELKRRDEAFQIRWGLNGSDSLPAGANVIYAGDFNQQSSAEDAYNEYPTLYENPYQIMLAGSAPWGTSGNGQGVDPISLAGSWHNNFTMARWHTQSPHDGTQGLVTGGMDDRFDFQLVSTDLVDGEGVSYIGPGVGDIEVAEHSYATFANDGSTYNAASNAAYSTALGWITDPSTRQQVLDASAKASDHLPVVADYQIPAWMQVTVATPPAEVIVGEDVTLDVTVSNIAPAIHADGADELDYSITTSGDLTGSASGIEEALGSGTVHTVNLPAGTIGDRSGQIDVTSSSQSVADGAFSQAVNYSVLAHSEASFSGTANDDAETIDLGGWFLGDGPAKATFHIHNFGGGDQAGLDITGLSGAGDTARLYTDVVVGLIAESANFEATLDTSAVGDFAATWTISNADEALPNAAGGDDLSLSLTGKVTYEGDFSFNFLLDAADIDLMFDAQGQAGGLYDLDDTGLVDGGDLDRLIRDLLGTEYGDANLDQVVDDADYTIWADSYGAVSAGWAQGDFNGDGLVDDADYTVWADHYGAAGLTPEPATLAILAAGAGTLLRRRREL